MSNRQKVRPTIHATPIPEDPPTNHPGSRGPWGEIAAQVKAQPGVWLRVADYPAEASPGSASSATKCLGKRGLEAVTRLTDDGKIRAVYARYLPDETSDVDGRLVDIAECYLEAVADDGDGIAAIIESHGLGESEALALVAEARTAGLIGAAA